MVLLIPIKFCNMKESSRKSEDMRLFCAEHLVKASQGRSLNLGASQSGTLNESKPKAQHEFSERDKQSI